MILLEISSRITPGIPPDFFSKIQFQQKFLQKYHTGLHVEISTSVPSQISSEILVGSPEDNFPKNRIYFPEFLSETLVGIPLEVPTGILI